MLQPFSISDPCYLAFSDAIQGKSRYGQKGYISGLYLPGERIFRAIYCQSSKKSNVAFPSIGAEILSAATSTFCGSMIAECTQQLFGFAVPLPFILTVYFNGLFSTIKTLHEGHYYRLRSTVARLHESYESGEIRTMR